MSKQVNYNENLCAGAAIRDDKGRRISKLFEAPHPKMTVGYARNLIMPSDPEEQEFNFRQAGGGVIEDGVAVIDKVKGNSVVWNQIIAKPYTFGLDRNYTFSAWYNGGSRSINDKGQFIFITNGETTGVGNSLCMTPRNTHKYLLSYKVKADIASVCTIYRRQSSGVIANISEADKWYFVSCIVDNVDTADYSSGLNAIVAANSPETTVTIDDAKVTDLTQMFGAGNEPTTVEEFLSRKPKVADEYAYNEGTIINNKVEGVTTTGVNLWNEEWELGIYKNDSGEKYTDPTRIRSKNPIACTPSTTYYAFYGNGNDQLYVYFYDENMGYITSSPYRADNRTFTPPSNARFFTLGTYGAKTTTYNHDICINLSDPTINGKYFPYEKHELDLAWVKDIKDSEGVKLFEDGLKSAGTAFDEVGKNKAVKRLGVKVFDGTEGLNGFAVKDDQTAVKAEYTFLTTTIEGSRYARVVGAGFYGQYNGGYYYDLWAAGFASVRSLIICLPYSVAKSGTEVKEYLKAQYNAGTPLIVYYELAEPIEVEYDEKNLTYPVVAGGTEEAIASEPSTAFRADIGYGIDAVKTILGLKARVEALEGK